MERLTMTMSLQRLFLVLTFLAICSVSLAKKYYVDATGGSDSNDGSASGKAWKTLSRVSSGSFSPGDSILFRRGGVWRESLTVSSSGSENSYIHFTAYGNGHKPRFLGSNSSSWSGYGTNIWVSDLAFTNPWRTGKASDIFFVNRDGTTTWGLHKSGIAGLTNPFDWTWDLDHIYVYSLTDPDLGFSSVEIPQRVTIIEPNNKKFLHFDQIDLFYSQSEGIGDGSYPNQDLSGLIIEKCHIAYLGSRTEAIGYGTTAVYSKMIVRKDTIHDCGRRSVSLNLYANGFTVSDVLIEGNVFFNGSHTTAVDMSIGTSSFNGSLDNITIRNNLIFEDPHRKFTSELIFAQNYGSGGKLTNLYIYNNVFKYPTISAIKLENVQSAYIYNNTFYGHNLDRVGNTFHLFIDRASTNIKVKNNIFYTLAPTDKSGTGLAIYDSQSQDHRMIDADYNLYFRANQNLMIIMANGSNYYLNSLPQLQSQIGWEKDSPLPDDPLFVSVEDLHLQSNSPAIGKGISLQMLSTDFDGKNYNSPPSMGAFEGNPPDEPVQPAKVLILYPNPTKDYVTIVRDNSTSETLSIKIVDITGRMVEEGILEKGRDEIKFPISLDSGLYVIRIMYEDATIAAQKLIVVN